MNLADYQALLDEWDGTPYMSGGCWKQKGVDCIRFVMAVLDELHGLPEKTTLKGSNHLPSDAALHDRKAAMRVIRFLQERYPNEVLFRRGDDELPKLQPGDVIVVEVGEDAPGHVMIVGADPSRIYHSASAHGGCTYTGIGCAKTNGIWAVWRSLGLHLEN